MFLTMINHQFWYNPRKRIDMGQNLKEKILMLKDELKDKLSIAAHFYQQDDVFELADFVGDSLELAKKASEDPKKFLIFCGVGFMGQSVKILAPSKIVLMPRIACCSMARMIDSDYFDKSIETMVTMGLRKDEILPVTYINSNAEVKAKVGKMGGLVCTSSSAKKIIQKALNSGKKIFFLPDRCLGYNMARELGVSACMVGESIEADVICYDGFCSVHQLFELSDIKFYREKFPGILIATHPECKPEVCEASDFVGSTSQIIEYVKNLPLEQKVAIGTEFNLVNRIRKTNTYVLSSTKPECPTMNDTTLEDLYNCLLSVKNVDYINEITLDKETIKWAKLALERMYEV